MRLALLVCLAAASAVPASAQSRFMASCLSSAGGDPIGEEACACGEREALAAGAAAERLNALVDHVGADGKLDTDALPVALRPTAELVMGSLVSCALGGAMEGMQEAFEGIGKAFEDAFSELGAEPSAAEPSAAETPSADVAGSGSPSILERIRGARSGAEPSGPDVPSASPSAETPRGAGATLRLGWSAPRTAPRATQVSRGATIRVRG